MKPLGKKREKVFTILAQVSEKVATFASGLKAVGLQAKGRVGVFGGNCPEWMIVMQAS